MDASRNPVMTREYVFTRSDGSVGESTNRQGSRDRTAFRVPRAGRVVDGPTLKLRLDLTRYPDQPPHKWVAQGFNTVQIELCLSGRT
ncbi:Imm50 family immunity protein [Streptomyces sp. RB17]|uniref:Imm50 family immunity protein n=1 Tax=Streptomyces sp. RB17 TaxID=2585197 RepID=UPI001295F5A4